jgi:hypothetical protein
MMAPMVGSGGVCFWRESGGVGFVLVRLAGIIRRYYGFFQQRSVALALSGSTASFCKDNAAINDITVQHKKRLIPVKFDGSYALIVVTRIIQIFTRIIFSIALILSQGTAGLADTWFLSYKKF